MSSANNKERLPELELIRGISMLGVIGIHIGSQYLMNPTPNIHLVALFEIFTRFSVPIFFFVSAFGLFWQRNLDETIDYRSFYLRRAKSVLIPYLFWSFFYIFHYTVLYRSTMLLHVREIIKYLETNENGKYEHHTKLRRCSKRGKFTAINVYIQKR